MKTLSKPEKLVYYNNRIYSIQFFFRLFSPLSSYFFYLDPGPHVGGFWDSLHVVWDLFLELPSPIFCLFCGL